MLPAVFTFEFGQDRGMASSAELSSLTSSLEDLAERVTRLAETARDTGDDDTAFELFAVERSLGGALRRLQRFTRGGRR